MLNGPGGEEVVDVCAVATLVACMEAYSFTEIFFD
jgi:hypothetical protein